VRKLLLLLLIAVVGAGIAFGANAVFFSPSSAERPASEPRGLVDEIAADDELDEATPKPSPSPSPSASPDGVTDGSSASSGGTDGSAPTSEDGDGPRTPRSASRVEGPEPSTFVVQGVVDEQDPPDDPCDLEESEAEQRECENEADREEDERDAEQDQDRHDDDD
jgi:hypothetical protein